MDIVIEEYNKKWIVLRNNDCKDERFKNLGGTFIKKIKTQNNNSHGWLFPVNKKEELIQKLASYKIEVNMSDNNSQIIKEDRIVFENEYKTPISQGVDNMSNSENSDICFNIVNIEKDETSILDSKKVTENKIIFLERKFASEPAIINSKNNNYFKNKNKPKCILPIVNSSDSYSSTNTEYNNEYNINPCVSDNVEEINKNKIKNGISLELDNIDTLQTDDENNTKNKAVMCHCAVF